MTTELTGGQALAGQLAREGLRDVFAVPGVQLDWAMDGIRQRSDQFAVHIPRHEQSTSYMADGCARSTGRIAVSLTVPGPGLLNAMAGLATAYACSSPVLAITGQIHSSAVGHGYGMLHEVRNQSLILQTVTKWCGTASTPQEIPGLVRAAVAALRTGRPRPVGIEIPHDVLSRRAPVDLLDAPLDFDGRLRPPVELVDAAAKMLRTARFPVIYAGAGVAIAEASAALALLAERLQAPVVMSESGRGALSDRHPLALTTLGGRVVFPHADVVLVVGSRFMNRMAVSPAWPSREPQYIFLNTDAEDAVPPRKVDLFLQADAALGLQALADALGASSRPPRRIMLDEVRTWADCQVADLLPQAAYVRALRRAIPEDGILVNELTQVGYLATIAYPVFHPRGLIGPGYQGTLGYGFPTALGVAVANPGRAVVSICGDGGFGWGLAELATARRYDAGLVTVVFNDGQFGNVRLLQDMTFGASFGVDLCNPDFVDLARAFGVAAHRVDTPQGLEQAMGQALARGGPSLIEVRVGPMPSAWHLFKLIAPFPPPSAAPAHPALDLS